MVGAGSGTFYGSNSIFIVSIIASMMSKPASLVTYLGVLRRRKVRFSRYFIGVCLISLEDLLRRNGADRQHASWKLGYRGPEPEQIVK